MRPLLKFGAHYVQNGEALRATLARGLRAFAVADLTLGSWSPRSLITQVMGQATGTELTYQPRGAQAREGSFGAAMSEGIDRDCKGSGALLDAAASASRIAKALGQRDADLYVMTPCYGMPWRLEDRLLVEYLSSCHPEVRVRLLVAGPDAAPWPEGWEVSAPGGVSTAGGAQEGDLLALWPGALSPNAQQLLASNGSPACVALANGWAVVAPEFRAWPGKAQWKASARQIAMLRHPSLQAVAAYISYHYARQSTHPWVFGAEAWKNAGGGYSELSLIYMKAAVETAKDETLQLEFETQAQLLRISMSAYAEAGQRADPSPNLPEETRSLLLEMKGWGLVMGGQPQPALPRLREALRLAKPAVIDSQYLFLMNITALAEVRCGFSTAALELEKRIESLILEHGVEDARLVFVNSLNLARLYRYGGDIVEAERYYERAFATSDGARTDTDAVNVNLSLARIAESKQDHAAALQGWVRGALHWLASESPEALNWRVQGLLVNKGALVKVASIREAYELVERLASVFLERLETLSRLCQRAVDAGAKDLLPLRFARPGATPGLSAAQRAIGESGWSVVAAGGPGAPRVFGPNYEHLQRWMTAFIQDAAGWRAGETSYWVVPRDGSETARSLEELSSTAAALGIKKITYEGVDYRIADGDYTEPARRASLNPLVSQVTSSQAATDAMEVTLSFRRYLKPRKLSETERQIFQAVRAQEGNVSRAKGVLQERGITGQQFEEALAQLQAGRVFQISHVVPVSAVPLSAGESEEFLSDAGGVWLPSVLQRSDARGDRHYAADHFRLGRV